MPVKITKLKGGKVRVSTPGGVKSKSTSLRKAMAQKRLLYAVEKTGWKPTGKKPSAQSKKAIRTMVMKQRAKKKPEKEKA